MEQVTFTTWKDDEGFLLVKRHRGPLAVTPASRATDPDTSHDAEAEINADGSRASQQHAVRCAVLRWPGRTSRELATKMGADRYMVARRLPELAPAHVRKGTARECSEGARRSLTWWPSDTLEQRPGGNN